MPLPTSGQPEEVYRIPAARNMSTPQNRCHHWQTNGACRFGAKCTFQPAEGMGEIQDGSDFISVKVSTFEIKKRAKETISTDARGLPALTLIRTARTQLLSAQEQEDKGNLALAYASYIKAATLVKLTIDSPEHVQSAKDTSTAIRMELAEFLENDGRDITGRAIALQEKLEGHTAESKVTLAPISNRFSNEKKENGPLQLQATINNTSTQRSSMSVVCRNWQRDGNCRFGQRCWFSHAIQEDRGKRAKAEGEEKQRKEKAERERQEREMAERERVERERLERERAEQERVERERLERERLKRERLERERAERERVEKEKAERVARERIQADARRRDEDPRPHPRISNKPAREHENKKCPRCSISIAKTKGYNHAKCKCGAHICWICLGYVTGGTIYQHIRNAHEGRIFDPAALDGANRGSTEVDKDALRAAQKREAERAERERRALEAQQQLARAQKAAKRREEEARAAQRSEARRREQEEQASKELRIRENQEHSARLQAALAMLSRAARRSEALRKEQEEQAREELRIRENQERIARLQAAPAAVARLAEEEKRRREEGGWCIIM